MPEDRRREHLDEPSGASSSPTASAEAPRRAKRFVLPALVGIAALAFLALLGFGVNNLTANHSIDARVARHRYPVAPASSAALPVLGSNRARSLRSFRGRLIVLNFYASWCDECQVEAPLLAREQQFLSQHDATLVGVTYEDASGNTQAFDRRFRISYPVLRDADGWLTQAYGLAGVPESFVINPAGRVVAVRRWPLTAQWFRTVVAPLLKHPSRAHLA